MGAFARKQFSIEHLLDLFEITGPVLKQFDSIAHLQYRHLILTIEGRDKVLRNLARGSDALCGICFSARIEQENHVRGNMTDTSDFLRFTIFQDEQIIDSQS